MNLKTMKHLKMKFGDALVQNVENLTMFIILSAQTVNIIISSRIYQRKPSFQAHLIRAIKFKTPKNPVHVCGRDFYLLPLTSSLLPKLYSEFFGK